MSDRNPGDGRTRRFATVQALRAFAAVIVLVGHTLEEAQSRFSVDFDMALRWAWLSGVDIFFVISGFIMVTTSWDRFARPDAPRLFLLHRIVRVVPLYWVFTTLIVLTMLTSRSALGATRFDASQILTSYLFWPYRRYDGVIQPALSVGWTLNYEMFFYASFTIVLFFRRTIGLALLFSVLLGLPLLSATLHMTSAPFVFWTDPIIIEFAYGVVIGIVLKQRLRWKLPPAVAVAALLAALVLFMAAHLLTESAGLSLPRFLREGGAAALVVALGTVTMPAKADAGTPRALTAIGDASYSIYLSHRFGLRIGTLILGRFVENGLLAPWVFVVGTVITCIILGQIVHVFCERPVTRLFQGLVGVRVRVDQRSELRIG